MGKKISVFREHDVEYLKDYLVEAVREVLAENVVISEAGLSAAEIGKYTQRIKTFIDKINKGAPFEMEDGTQVVLPADKNADLLARLSAALEPEADSLSGKLSAVTADGQTISTSKLSKTQEFGGKSGSTSQAEGEACETMDSTAFEGNIIYGLLYLSRGEKAAQSFLDAARQERKGIVCTTGALEQGITAAKTLVPKIKEAGLDPGDTYGTSGGKITASLTSAYTLHGVKSKEPKADIGIGKTGVSVKKYEESQFVSAQGPELAAIFDVAMKYIAKDKGAELNEAIDKFTDGIERAVGSAGKAHAVNPETGKREKGQADFYGIRGKLSRQTTTSKGKVKTDDTPYQKLLNKFLNLDGIEDISDEEKEQLRSAFAGSTADGFVELKESVKDIIGDDNFRVAICKEAITGEFKFNEDLPKATAMLKWSTKDPSKADFIALRAGGNWNDGWFSKVASRAKLEIRDRGTGRGGSMRGEFDKRKNENLQLDVLSEGFSDQDLLEIDLRTEEIYQRMMGSQLLQENFIKSIGAALSKGKDWVKAAAGKVTKAIASMVAKVTQWFKKLLNKGVSYVLNFLGIEPVSLEISI